MTMNVPSKLRTDWDAWERPLESGEHAFRYWKNADGSLELDEHGQPRPKWFVYSCPRHDGMECSVPLTPQRNSGGHTWLLSGTLEAPTLMPSIDCKACGWHGWVKDGCLTLA